MDLTAIAFMEHPPMRGMSRNSRRNDDLFPGHEAINTPFIQSAYHIVTREVCAENQVRIKR